MSADFGEILQGLMDNRGLTSKDVSHATGRAQTTVRQLLGGTLEPSVEMLRELAGVLHISVPDLAIIAGCREMLVQEESPPAGLARIGDLITYATGMKSTSVDRLIELARELQASELDS